MAVGQRPRPRPWFPLLPFGVGSLPSGRSGGCFGAIPAGSPSAAPLSLPCGLPPPPSPPPPRSIAARLSRSASFSPSLRQRQAMGSQPLSVVGASLLRPTALAADRNSRPSLASWLRCWLSEASLQKAVVASFSDSRFRSNPSSRLPVFIGWRDARPLIKLTPFRQVSGLARCPSID